MRLAVKSLVKQHETLRCRCLTYQSDKPPDDSGRSGSCSCAPPLGGKRPLSPTRKPCIPPQPPCNVCDPTCALVNPCCGPPPPLGPPPCPCPCPYPSVPCGPCPCGPYCGPCTPCIPCGPAGPCGPCIPCGACRPCGPCGPCVPCPCNPFAPCEEAKSVNACAGPCGPYGPCGPCGPCGPYPCPCPPQIFPPGYSPCPPCGPPCEKMEGPCPKGPCAGRRRICPPPCCSDGPIAPNPCCPRFPKPHSKRYKTLFCLMLPLIVLLSLSILGHEPCHKGPCREFEYMRRRNKRFPWGEGNKTFFHNDHTNSLPEECEPPPMVCLPFPPKCD